VAIDVQIGIICAIGGFLIALFTFARSRDNEVKSDASENAVIKTKLDSISAGVSYIQIDIKAYEKRVSELSERVIRVEESNKQAHKRIDSIENKGE
jgi:septal ring factor EnvC (AmiA/AmiB activator)